MAEVQSPSVQEMVEQCANAASFEDCRRLAYALYCRGVLDALRPAAPALGLNLTQHAERIPLTGSQLGEILAGVARGSP